MVFKLIIMSFLYSFMANCQSDRLKFITIDDIPQDTPVNQLGFNLRDFLYLDTGYVSAIAEIDSSYSSKAYKNISRFIINDQGKHKIELESTYRSIKELLLNSDKNVSSFVTKRFGLEKNKYDISDIVLVSDDKAFVKYNEANASYALVFHLVAPGVVVVGLAYILAS